MPKSEHQTAILIAAYNAEATIERAVRSAVAEPEAAEICVVDDGSIDGTVALVRAIAEREPRVSLHVQPRNAGPAAARNAAIANTRSPWLTVLDADDYLLPGRLAALHAHSAGADFVADALIRTDGQQPLDWAPSPLSPAPLSLTAFLLGNLGATRGPLDLGFLKPLMRRSFLAEHGLRYREDMRLGEDYELYARALALGARFLVCGEAGYVSVERPGSLSKDHSETDLERLRDCDDGVATIRPLAPAERTALRKHWMSVDRRLQWRRLISAVKARDPAMALSTFRSLDASLYLAGKLAEQVWLRGTGRGPHRALSTNGTASAA
ncbi:MAG: glycosyltransferase family 2 protein [Hyphomonadaceae bacterium]|nr:glycosyltransferase family 2 protein [Hyphomonadaceae bacterium]GIK47583.1 MAG: glycosyl transferase family A [Alphaproteobacteria bacterium]